MAGEPVGLRPQEAFFSYTPSGDDDLVARCVESIRRSVAGQCTRRESVTAVRMLLTSAFGARAADRIVSAWLERLARSGESDGAEHPYDLVALVEAERRRTRLARRAGEAALEVLSGVVPLPVAGIELGALGELAGTLPAAAFSWLAGTGRDEPREAAEAGRLQASSAAEAWPVGDPLSGEAETNDEAARIWARLGVVTFLEALEQHVNERALPRPAAAASAASFVA